MPYLPQLLALAGVWAIVVISPGPNFVATVYHATSRSRRDGILVALGIATGTTLWVTFSIVGLGVLFARFSWLVEIVRTVGALYLTYLGCKMIWHARKKALPMEGARQTRGLPLHAGTGEASSHPQISLSSQRRGSPWRVGFLTDISNPKAAAFFGSLFALFLPAHAPLWFQIACVVTVVMIAVSWYSTVACLFSLGPIARTYQRVKRWIDYITGGILIALGVRLAVSK